METVKSVIITVLCGIGIVIVLAVGWAVYEGETVKENPITASLRSSSVGLGKVMVFTNSGRDTLHNVRLVVHNDAKGQTQRFIESSWGPGEVKELGWREGWMVESGERIVVKIDGYTENSFTAR